MYNNFIPATFKTTYDLFRSYLDYSKPLSFEEWSEIDDSFKAAALYVQFYKEITLVWIKIGHPCVEPEEVISTILQYLCKQVDIIQDNKSKFYGGYIFRVIYNCVYCLTELTEHNRSKYRLRWENEQSMEITTKDSDTINILDIWCPQDEDMLDVLLKDKLQAILGQFTDEQLKIVSYIEKGSPYKLKEQEQMKLYLRKCLFEYI